MKKVLKIIGYIFLVIILIVAGGFIYFISKYPDVDKAPDIKVELTKERVERGKYLANHVTVCMDCHSTRDWTKFSGPVKPGTIGKGGEKFGKELGIPGVIYTKNITPYNLKNWTDGEIFRLITTGVNKKGNAIFPMMPFTLYNKTIAKEDVYSIIAYLRTLEPIKYDVPESQVDFPLSYIMRTIPTNYTPKSMPDKSNPKEYGKYLVNIAACVDCHTPSVEGKPVEGKTFAGGAEFNLPWGIVRPANLTPDKETGLGNWTKEYFISRFKTYDKPEMKVIPVSGKEFNSVMPWTLYSGMTEEDLSAIYEYLRTVKPVNNLVVKYTPPKETLVKN